MEVEAVELVHCECVGVVVVVVERVCGGGGGRV